MDSITATTKAIKAGRFPQKNELPEIKIPAPYFVEIRRSNLLMKRAADLIISSLLLICIFSWLYPVMFLLIKISSKGPVIFLQKRVGKNDKIFYCRKFRTMYVNTLADIKEAAENDDRITPLGKWLRKLYIDELPQLINVFLGDMSIIGPRPHMLLHHKQFLSSVPYYNKRHIVKPGITGLAQVMGYHGSVAEYYQINGRTRLDLFYVRKLSVWLDIRILLATFFITFRFKKIYKWRKY